MRSETNRSPSVPKTKPKLPVPTVRVWYVCYCEAVTYLRLILVFDHQGMHEYMLEPQIKQKFKKQGFPGDSVVKDPAAKAGDAGSIPGPGRPHMQRSGSARGPALLGHCSRACAPEPRGPRRPLKPPLHSKRSPRSPRPERPRRNEDPAQPKINKIKLL